jgi:TfoX/Sxy family transcriptional regulator of competence genes
MLYNTGVIMDLHKINKIVLKLNELEDSKLERTFEERLELSDRQFPLLKELYAEILKIISIW